MKRERKNPKKSTQNGTVLDNSLLQIGTLSLKMDDNQLQELVEDEEEDLLNS